MKKLFLSVLIMFMLSACGSISSGSVVGTWKLVSYGSPSTPIPAVPDVDTSIEFTSDGQVSGNVGCNGFGGDYKVEGDKITFGAIISTMMACENPINEQESSVLNVFKETASYTLDGDTLTITSANGNSSVVLART